MMAKPPRQSKVPPKAWKEGASWKVKKKKNDMSNNTKHLLAILILLMMFSFPYLLEQSKVMPEQWKVAGQKSHGKTDSFNGLSLGAKAAYVLDMATGRSLYAHNEEDKLPLASLAKMMTAIVATDLVPESTVITVDKNDIKEEGDSGLFVGEKWRMSDIIDFTLTTSSNDGASAVAAVAGSMGQNLYGTTSSEARSSFVEEMNIKTQELELLNTYFFNETCIYCLLRWFG